PSLECEQATWPLLDEEDDQNEHEDLAEYRADRRFEELVENAERQRADQRSPKIADAAEHHHHEAVDNVALAKVWRHIVDLRECHTSDAGNAGTKREGESINPGGADAHG